MLPSKSEPKTGVGEGEAPGARVGRLEREDCRG